MAFGKTILLKTNNIPGIQLSTDAMIFLLIKKSSASCISP